MGAENEGAGARKPYRSDLSDERWALIEPVIAAWKAHQRCWRRLTCLRRRGQRLLDRSAVGGCLLWRLRRLVIRLGGAMLMNTTGWWPEISI
ncbi:hypothetical protein ACFQ07_02255 [Actinomadura adrarensis]|uniref:Transposase n=1 Tax=Actinomadura adrarensis TaxID=1819600 RepID=A0ABW3C9A3_9ACTN